MTSSMECLLDQEDRQIRSIGIQMNKEGPWTSRCDESTMTLVISEAREQSP
jgi:hypothetical protein